MKLNPAPSIKQLALIGNVFASVLCNFFYYLYRMSQRKLRYSFLVRLSSIVHTFSRFFDLSLSSWMGERKSNYWFAGYLTGYPAGYTYMTANFLSVGPAWGRLEGGGRREGGAGRLRRLHPGPGTALQTFISGVGSASSVSIWLVDPGKDYNFLLDFG